MNCEINITSKDQIERISRLASREPYDVYLSTDTVILDARSLVGLFSLVGKRVRMVAGDRVDPQAFCRLVDKCQ